MKQTLMDQKEKMSYSTITDENFKTRLSIIDRTNTQNISKDIRDLIIINQHNLTDIYGILTQQLQKTCSF